MSSTQANATITRANLAKTIALEVEKAFIVSAADHARAST